MAYRFTINNLLAFSASHCMAVINSSCNNLVKNHEVLCSIIQNAIIKVLFFCRLPGSNVTNTEAHLQVVSRSVHELMRLGPDDLDKRGGGGTLTSDSSARSSPEHVIHPSLCESWLVTPPPCFTAGGPSEMPHPSPLENLLIEHPSMSVYGLRPREHSAGEDSQQSSVSSPEDHPSSQAGRALASSHPSSRSNILTARASLQQAQVRATRSMQKSTQKYEQQRLARKALQRSNRVQRHNSRAHRQRRSDRMLHHSGRNNNRKMHH